MWPPNSGNGIQPFNIFNQHNKWCNCMLVSALLSLNKANACESNHTTRICDADGYVSKFPASLIQSSSNGWSYQRISVHIYRRVPRCPKHPTYPLDQSILPRKVLEGAQRLEDLAERQHLESCRRIEKDAAELLPQAGHMGHGAYGAP